MPSSYAYILNSKPFRENSLLLDIFTEDFGRICCVARPAKKRGKVLKGTIQPFRYLKLQWIGKGDVQTLTDADERGRHTIPPSEMMMGLYLNELLLLLSNQHTPMPEVFSAYKYTLHKLGDPLINQQIMMRFELYLLEHLGYSIDLDCNEEYGNQEKINQEHCNEERSSEEQNDEENDEALTKGEGTDPQTRYCFKLNEGLKRLATNQIASSQDIIIHADLLLALHDIQNMSESQWQALRVFLDAVFKRLSPRTINTRRLLQI